MFQDPALTGVMMSNPLWLTDDQMQRLKPFSPKGHGMPQVEDRRVLNGMTFINRNGLRWCDAPREYEPPKTLNTGTAALPGSMADAEWLIADRGSAAHWFRDALKDSGYAPESRAGFAREDRPLRQAPKPDRDHGRQTEGPANRRENSPPDCFLILLIHRHMQ